MASVLAFKIFPTMFPRSCQGLKYSMTRGGLFQTLGLFGRRNKLFFRSTREMCSVKDPITNGNKTSPSKYIIKPVPLIIKGKLVPDLYIDLIWNNILDKNMKVVSDQHPNLLGSDFALKYDLGLVTLPGHSKPFRLCGEMPMASKWQPPKTQLVLKKDYVSGLETVSNYIEEFGMAKKGTEFHAKQMDAASYIFSVTTIPSGLLVNDGLKNYLLWCVFFFHLDDLMDNKTDLRLSEFRPMEAVRCMDFLCEALAGMPFNEEKMTSSGNIPKLRVLWNIFADFRKRLIGKSTTKDQWEPSISALIEWVETTAWEREGWSCPDVKEWGTEIYWTTRDTGIAHWPSLEIICHSANISITSEMRRDPLMKYLLRLWARLTTLANDICSLPKEIEKGEFNNFFLIAAQTDSKKTGADLLHQVQTQIFPGMVKEVRFIESQLLVKYKNDANLALYLDCGKRFYEGLAMWSFIAERYRVEGKKIEVAFSPN